MAVGRYDDAIREFDYALKYPYAAFFEDDPWIWPEVHYFLGVAYDEIGMTQKATDYLTQFLAFKSHSQWDEPETQDAGVRLANHRNTED